MVENGVGVEWKDISQFKRKYREKNEGNFPKTLEVVLEKEPDGDKKYGENPQQHCAVYIIQSIAGKNARITGDLTNLRFVRTDTQGKGGLSLTNEMDITRAMSTLAYFRDVPAVVIMKHNIIAGFAKQTSPDQKMVDLFRLARDADRQSNFGGTAVFTRGLDRATAEAMYELRGQNPFFVDVLAAPGYEHGVLDYVQSQADDIRIAEFAALDKLPRFVGDETFGLMSLKEMPTGRMGVQDLQLTSIRTAADLVLRPGVIDREGKPHVIDYVPNGREVDDLITSWWLNVAGVKSNGLVGVRRGVSQAIGSGQVERFGATAQMIVKGVQKAMDIARIKYDPLMGINYDPETKRDGFQQLAQTPRGNPFEDACVTSDAFFPFADSIHVLARAGVRVVMQPYGSKRDADIIDAANQYKMAMPATGERCFLH